MGFQQQHPKASASSSSGEASNDAAKNDDPTHFRNLRKRDFVDYSKGESQSVNSPVSASPAMSEGDISDRENFFDTNRQKSNSRNDEGNEDDICTASSQLLGSSATNRRDFNHAAGKGKKTPTIQEDTREYADDDDTDTVKEKTAQLVLDQLGMIGISRDLLADHIIGVIRQINNH